MFYSVFCINQLKTRSNLTGAYPIQQTWPKLYHFFSGGMAVNVKCQTTFQDQEANLGLWLESPLGSGFACIQHVQFNPQTAFTQYPWTVPAPVNSSRVTSRLFCSRVSSQRLPGLQKCWIAVLHLCDYSQKNISWMNGNRTICQQTNSRSDNSQISQLTETFDLKFTVNNCYKCDMLQITHCWTL